MLSNEVMAGSFSPQKRITHYMYSTLIASCQELLFPSYCLECGQRLPCRELPLFCSECLANIATVNAPKCTYCGMPFQSGVDHLCGLCLKKKYAFDQARVALFYQEPVASLISTIKFNGSLAGLATLGHLAKLSKATRELSEPDVIIPVPLHRKRLRQRKFNQALLVCRSCFPSWKEKINPYLLVRHKETSPQTGLNGVERRKNLAQAFSITHTDMIKDKKILLVDDVFTTGQTVHECSKVLRKAGAKRIEVFTLARAM